MKYSVSILVSIALLLSSLFAQQRMTRREYIERYKDIAISQMKTHGIPASITLAQACLESGDGNSPLAVRDNNHFGIKCHTDWNGKKAYHDDDLEGECFRKYNNPRHSFEDHANFLRYRDRYAFLFDLEITDYKGWAQGLKKANYATDPLYAQRLIKIIEENELYRYDIAESIPPSPLSLIAVKEYIPAKSSSMYKYSKARTLYIQNNVVYLIANANDSFEDIAAEYNLFEGELLRFNDLNSSDKLSPGAIVYLEHKCNKAERHQKMHIAEYGETYYQISQRYAIKLRKLLKINKLPKDAISPTEGEEIYLR